MGRIKTVDKVIPLGELMDTDYSYLAEQEQNVIGKRLSEARQKRESPAT